MPPTMAAPLSAAVTCLRHLNNAVNDDAVVQNDENACVDNDDVVTMILTQTLGIVNASLLRALL